MGRKSLLLKTPFHSVPSSSGFPVRLLPGPLFLGSNPLALIPAHRNPIKAKHQQTPEPKPAAISLFDPYFRQESKKMIEFREQCFPDQQEQPKKGQKSSKNKREPVKIKYISSPTMVKATSATEFMAIVQELTGKDSKVEDPFDAIEVASQVPRYGTPQVDVGSVDGAFCNYTSPFLQTEDGIVWGRCF